MAKVDETPLGLRPTGLLSLSSLRQPAPIKPAADFVDVQIEASNDNGVTVDPDGSVTIINDDGTVDVDIGGPSGVLSKPRDDRFDGNLADIIDPFELNRLAGDLLMGIEQDDQSRQEWLDTRAEGLRTLGLKIESPRSSIDTTAALEGMSNVRHPLLLDAVLNYWANATGELLPAAGPVKVEDKLTRTGESQELAEQLEGDFNYYLTTVATEYYPDTSKALLNVGFGGCVFKKVYRCPLRQRPVSESIDAVNLIVSNAVTDLYNSARVTHVSMMRPSVLRRMQLAGAYRDVPLSTPSGVIPNAVEETIANIQGIQINSQQIEDREHTVYECYCELNIKGFEDKKKGKETGLPLPYRVVIEKDSQQILEVRRNWKKDDETKRAKSPFIAYFYVPGLGFYGIGLLHILGNTTNALTAAWRETLDAGMFANFPGFLYSKLLGRQNSNEFRVPPGGGIGLDFAGDDIHKAVMPLPYKDVSPAFVEFQKHVLELGQKVGGSANVKVAEGRQDAPVGTTLAQLEQATRVETASHKELWRSQSQEFILMKELFRENPEDFIKAMQQRGGEVGWDADKFLRALNDCSLIPQADPNTPSHMHRLMKAMGLIQLDKAYPGVMSPEKIVKRIVGMLGFGDFEALKNDAPPGAGGIPPEVMLEMQKLADKSEDRAFKEKFEQLKFTNSLMLAREAAEQEKLKLQGQMQMQERESADQEMQSSVDLQQSHIALRDTEIEAAADVEVERIRGENEGVAGKHALAAEKQRTQTEDTKGKHTVAAAKAKPKPKQTAKK